MRYATLSGSRVCSRDALGLTNADQEDPRRALHTPSSPRCSNSRFDPDSSGCLTTWDSIGIWDNRIDEPIMLPSSIRYGKLIPKVCLTKLGCASLIGQRKENEDPYQLSLMRDNIRAFHT
ncbi:protein phosphatase 1K, mitochondrial-like [Megalobrama amblycephala]|uniref:protein phosphatase 1K, mitochondrial-like n=1 Tax=Megalobrama amblycephala TaxID=75352 RepID=UPI002014146E|nr:protein phosphatase 1K, mitochondrial-like [Megalobrama amblycephala]